MSAGAAAARQESPHARSLRRQQDVRLRRYGFAVLVTVLLPLSMGAEGGLYLWDVIGVVRWTELVGQLAPFALAAGLVALSYAPAITRFGQSALALVALGTATAWLTFSPLALEASFQGLLSFVGRRPLLVATGLALVGAGADLRLDDATAGRRDLSLRLARALLIAGVALLVLVYVLPQRGSPFGLVLAEQIAMSAWHGGPRVVAGRVLFWALGLLPLGVAIGAAIALARPRLAGTLLGVAARYGLSLLAVLLCIPLLAAELDAHRALLQARTAILLGVAIGVAARSVEGLVRHLLETPLPATGPPSMLARDVRLRRLVALYRRRPDDGDRTVLEARGAPGSHRWLRWLMARRLDEVAAELPRPPRDAQRPDASQAASYAAVLAARFDRLHSSTEDTRPEDPLPPTPRLTGLSLWVLSGRWRLAVVSCACLLGGLISLAALLRERPADLAWRLGSPTDAADKLFGETLPRYVVLLARRSESAAAEQAGAEEVARATQQAEQLVGSAREVDALLGERIDRLVRAAGAVDRTGRLWLDAVHAVNRRVRAIGLPYYLDGNVMHLRTRRRGAARRVFYVTSYRVEQVRRFEADGEAVAALHVRRLDRLNIAGSRLGAVRADEPFALVLLDSIERSVEQRLEALAERSSCGLTLRAWSTAGTAAEIDALCSRTLERLADAEQLAVAEVDPDTVRAFVGRQIDATERHELQHQIDGPRLTVPPALYRATPWADDEAVRATARELSAHMAELDSEDSLAVAWRLADLSTYLVRPRSRAPYRFAAATIVGRLLGASVVDGRGRVSSAAVLRFWQEVADRGPDLAAWVAPEIRDAHEELFGTPIADLRPGR
ncbi:MAG: hypothetical protein JRI23_29460 [Deltaproteobacteria bacterium]|jgi:hypothetical protein|nr:hypothetical protein [Deltaproteobacteria bacterium]MBW2536281.1 hypothetical protein [Deltaproteobacteria bacterium]